MGRSMQMLTLFRIHRLTLTSATSINAECLWLSYPAEAAVTADGIMKLGLALLRKSMMLYLSLTRVSRSSPKARLLKPGMSNLQVRRTVTVQGLRGRHKTTQRLTRLPRLAPNLVCMWRHPAGWKGMMWSNYRRHSWKMKTWRRSICGLKVGGNLHGKTLPALAQLFEGTGSISSPSRSIRVSFISHGRVLWGRRADVTHSSFWCQNRCAIKCSIFAMIASLTCTWE